MMAFLRAIDEPPEGLFKFRRIREEKDKRELLQLLNGRVYFPTMSQFNDPFEGRVLLLSGDPGTFHERLLAHVRRVATARGEVVPTEPPTAIPAEFAAQITAQHQHRMRNDHRYLCLTGTKRSPLLWSHYADSHRGVCVEFGVNTHPFGNALKVDYDPEYPTHQAVSAEDRDQGDLLKKSVLTKAEYWQHENEYRLMSIRGDNPTWHLDCPWSDDRKTLHFNPRAIVGITLGAAMENEERDSLLEYLTTEHRYPIKVEQADVCEDQYALKFRDLFVPRALGAPG